MGQAAFESSTEDNSPYVSPRLQDEEMFPQTVHLHTTQTVHLKPEVVAQISLLDVDHEMVRRDYLETQRQSIHLAATQKLRQKRSKRRVLKQKRSRQQLQTQKQSRRRTLRQKR